MFLRGPFTSEKAVVWFVLADDYIYSLVKKLGIEVMGHTILPADFVDLLLPLF
jgi:hypothetical protein